MPFTKANDINIYYEIHGKGTPLVLISGFSSHHLFWKDYIAPLSKDYQLLIFDNRGAGQTDAPEIPYSIEMMAEDTAALMEVLGMEDAHVMGLSMGGAIAMQLCVHHRDKIRKAVIGCSAAILPETAKMFIKTTQKLFENAPKEIVWESRLPLLFSNAFLSDPQNIKQYIHDKLHDPYPQSPAGYLGQIDALMQFDLRKDLNKIEAKTLIVTGDEDLFVPPFCAHYLKKHIPESELTFIKEQGHVFPLERPQELIGIIKKFFTH